MLFVATSHDTWPFLLLFLLSQVTTPFCSYNFCFCSFYQNELRSYTVSHFILTSFPPTLFVCLSCTVCHGSGWRRRRTCWGPWSTCGPPTRASTCAGPPSAADPRRRSPATGTAAVRNSGTVGPYDMTTWAQFKLGLGIGRIHHTDGSPMKYRWKCRNPKRVLNWLLIGLWVIEVQLTSIWDTS